MEEQEKSIRPAETRKGPSLKNTSLSLREAGANETLQPKPRKTICEPGLRTRTEPGLNQINKTVKAV